MELKGFLGWIYKICNGLMYLAYLNLLWLFFCLGGLAFFPSTVAMFSVTRRWVMGKKDTSIFSTFWDNYKKEFWNTQSLGLLFLMIGLLLYVNYKFFTFQTYTTAFVGKVFIFSIAFIYIITLFNFFPIYVHFKLSTLTYLKNSILFGFLYLISSIVMLIVESLLLGIFIETPALFVVLGGSISALWITWMVQKSFIKIELKNEGTKIPAA
jgi:uncharacterized membrane protein YesL